MTRSENKIYDKRKLRQKVKFFLKCMTKIRKKHTKKIEIK